MASPLHTQRSRFDAVDKKLTGSEVHSVGTHFPNTVQFFIVATESSTIFFGKVFVLHRYLTYLYPPVHE